MLVWLLVVFVVVVIAKTERSGMACVLLETTVAA